MRSAYSGCDLYPLSLLKFAEVLQFRQAETRNLLPRPLGHDLSERTESLFFEKTSLFSI